ncbi:acyl-ACP--UDP-N- acetylglucosamine O-acyltransferase [Aeromicrobium endophyticum]|uniref:Acyl-ACP--UDP-N-acetylglucosamine O-acyltransferase n=1 Tax=Aeromicrobium endophyticum TaxID=2292704 RepID=A0A371PBK2_9ACTN|nr:acyl-ACP--UDP-N- acetylglucosamine O-acyltransferase [Aeromicrobium endophyticum]REK72840.1 acyl-ACP--UDP-N- acetylglucosamine O-acyltransferase [Aeromicrobium endophyticum]
MNAIHPSAVVGPEVTMGTGNVIGPFAVLVGRVELGDHNWIGSGVTIGAPPEVRGWDHPTSWDSVDGGGVQIGHRNVLREGCQIHQGWKAVTKLGDDGFIMNQVYVAHDCRLGSHVTMASGARLAGHVVVQDRANLGMGALVHQRRVIGAGVMVGMGSVVTRDVPPLALVMGNPSRISRSNRYQAERIGLSAEDCDRLDAAYRSDLSGVVAVELLASTAGASSLVEEWVSARG